MADEDLTQAQLKSDVTVMKADLSDMKASINRIADALTKLAILEDRQSAQMTLMEKTLSRLEALEDKQHATELRFATAMVSQERLANVESKVNEMSTKITGYEASGRTIGYSVKIFWAVFGGGITASIGLIVSKLF